jgi:hypothetical protein
VRDIETIDSELRLVAFLRHAARKRGGPLPSIDVADALLDERRCSSPPSTLSAPSPLGLLTPLNEAETLSRANARIHTHVWMDGHSANPQWKGMIEWRF